MRDEQTHDDDIVRWATADECGDDAIINEAKVPGWRGLTPTHLALLLAAWPVAEGGPALTEIEAGWRMESDEVLPGIAVSEIRQTDDGTTVAIGTWGDRPKLATAAVRADQDETKMRAAALAAVFNDDDEE